MNNNGGSEQCEELQDANRILVKHNVLDAYGHVSVRDNHNKERFLLSRNLAPGQVTPDDIQSFTLDGHTNDPRKPYLEKHIHSEIYKLRPDVRAVIHSHAAAVLPFTLVEQALKPVSHMAGFLVSGVPVFEIRDVAGDDTDLLITNSDLGQSLASCLGESAVCLMRGHGLVVVGESLAQAVHRAVFTLLNAATQSEALHLDDTVTYLTEMEGKAASRSNDTQVNRAWELWRNEVRAWCRS